MIATCAGAEADAPCLPFPTSLGQIFERGGEERLFAASVQGRWGSGGACSFEGLRVAVTLIREVMCRAVSAA